MHSQSLRPLSSGLRAKLIKSFEGRILVLDRFGSLAGLPLGWPHKALAGAGFAGPISDLHARMLLALLCTGNDALPTTVPQGPAVWKAGDEFALEGPAASELRRKLQHERPVIDPKRPSEKAPSLNAQHQLSPVEKRIRVADCALGRPAPKKMFPTWAVQFGGVA